MMVSQGKSALKGIAIGKVYLFQNQKAEVVEKTITDTEAETARFHAARESSMKQLEDLYDKALSQVGEEQAMIFEVHRMMLEDLDFIENTEEKIRDGKKNAEYAVKTTGEEMSQVFASLEDDYMRARSADVLDVAGRVVENLMGISGDVIMSDEPVILLAEDLTPSETVQMDKSKILAFVCTQGSLNSHTAILARSMNIPSLMKTDLELRPELHGKTAIVDGFMGQITIEPDEAYLDEMTKKKLKYEEAKRELNKLIGLENVTTDGRKINLYANIGNSADVEKVLENDAGGIGLFRSEFIYLGREDYPTEEEQFRIYKEVISKMDGRKVIIRTLDIGADKQADYFQIPKEENPAMGYRAIRICLDRVNIFKDQLRAIYRASAFGTAAIMFPMIISVDEIRKIKGIVEEVKQELDTRGDAYGKVELGIMVETPAAALISDKLAEEVEFFSIGTNDLTQYTLAIDRQNQSLDNIYDSHHEAVLRLIKMTVENGHKAGIWVGICGELAADDTLTEEFLDMGLDELSVSPTYILGLRKKIREL